MRSVALFARKMAATATTFLSKSTTFRTCSSTVSSLSTPSIVVVIGATASGKSKLAEAIAQSRKAALISADSMQIYRGLDIGTAKPTKEEREKYEYRNIDTADPGEEFSAAKFRDLTLKEVEKAVEEGRLPVIVGGTNFYLQSLLWPSMDELEKERKSGPEGSPATTASPSSTAALLSLSSSDESSDSNSDEEPSTERDVDEGYRQLQEVDPVYAAKVHHRDRRKIFRALKLYRETGEKMSEVSALAEASPPRYRTLIFWVYRDRNELHERINARVDEMVQEGLVLESLLNIEKMGKTANGAIGYKEFLPLYSFVFSTGDEREEREESKDTSIQKAEARKETKSEVITRRQSIKDAVRTRRLLEALHKTFSPSSRLLSDWTTTNAGSYSLCETDDAPSSVNADGSGGDEKSCCGRQMASSLATRSDLLGEDENSDVAVAVGKAEECIEAVKVATRRYAKRQETWIRNRIVPRVKGDSFPAMHIYRIPLGTRVERTSLKESDRMTQRGCDDEERAALSTLLKKRERSTERSSSSPIEDVDEVVTKMEAVAMVGDLVELFWRGREEVEQQKGEDRYSRFRLSPSQTKGTVEGVTPTEKYQKYVCEKCDRTLNGLSEWTAHLSSKQHRKMKRRRHQQELELDGTIDQRPK